MFCSSSITMHLARGAAALLMVLGGLVPENLPMVLRLAALGAAFALMRGCPMCWLLGLIEAWSVRRRATNRL